MKGKKEVKPTLAETLNFTSEPGRHSKLSPVVGSRIPEIELIHLHREIFADYQKIILPKQKLNVFPLSHRQEADRISKEIFAQYIEKYAIHGLTIENAVRWSKVGANKTRIHDLENQYNTWNLEVLASPPGDRAHILDGMYRPAYLVALWVLMSVEETNNGQREADDRYSPVDKVLAVTRTLILTDEVYKRTFAIPLDKEVDYDNNFILFGKQIPQGRLANFYRQLESEYGSLAKALVSEESLAFLGYDPSMEMKKVSPKATDKGQANVDHNCVKIRYPELPTTPRSHGTSGGPGFFAGRTAAPLIIELTGSKPTLGSSTEEVD
ncbi:MULTISPECIES: hypothetical protein [Legionella]|uniref:Uncharacterized protein n=1 Tax=Legionella drozanskii LLAP-1 TaxID=1212489 RepID=A0A0W0SQT4_9GAMM|nr:MULTISPECIES: hypothetical protein [Legionella]KTC85617.1 hypothetical protein Ldro_1942 [Legionella drozanskii LLAP-1]PJE16154.1 MAG: hypothetical protein CK430_03655 [Legionella sp.]